MTTLPTQSAVTRAVKAAIKGAHELGYRVSWDPRNSERERDKRDYATAEYRDIVERVGSCGLCSQSGERLAKAGDA